MAYLAGYHEHLDRCLSDEKTSLMRQALAIGDTTKFWKLWSNSMETAATSHASIRGREATKFHGHGMVRTRRETVLKATSIAQDFNGTSVRNIPDDTLRLQRLAIRCQAWADRRIITERGGLDEGQKNTFEDLNRKVKRSIKIEAARTRPEEDELIQAIWQHEQGDMSDNRFTVVLVAAARKLSGLFQSL